MTNTKLVRSESDRMVAGVAGGIAEHYELDATLVRLIWVLSLLFGGVGLIVYVIVWAVIPAGTPISPPARIAEQRFARGEIDAAELERIRDELKRDSDS